MGKSCSCSLLLYNLPCSWTCWMGQIPHKALQFPPVSIFPGSQVVMTLWARCLLLYFSWWVVWIGACCFTREDFTQGQCRSPLEPQWGFASCVSVAPGHFSHREMDVIVVRQSFFLTNPRCLAFAELFSHVHLQAGFYKNYSSVFPGLADWQSPLFLFIPLVFILQHSWALLCALGALREER